MTRAATMTVRQLQREEGWTLAEIRGLDERGELPIEWKDPRTRRSGRFWREDYKSFKARRFERAQERVRQRQLRRSFVKGSQDTERLPEFLREAR